MFDTLYLIVNLIPLPYWLLMIVLPRHPYTRRLTTGWSAYLLLGLLYVVTLGLALVGAANSGLAFDVSLDGLAAMLGTPAGTLVAWVHMLTFDLFVGVWIHQESLRAGVPRWVASGCLFFTLMTGPLGLLLFLVWRSIGSADATSAQ